MVEAENVKEGSYRVRGQQGVANSASYVKQEA